MQPRGVEEQLAHRSRKRRNTLSEVGLAQSRRPPRNDPSPILRFEDREIADLLANGRRVRKRDAAQLERLKTSIAQFGFVRPVLVGGDGEIVDGQLSVEAAQALGLSRVPVIVVDHLNKVELRALRLALNRIGELGTWDADQLAAEVGELIQLDAPLWATGFKGEELDILLLEDEPVSEAAHEEQLEVCAEAITRRGDLWVLGNHRLLCGDARDASAYVALLGREEVQLVLTDVPYNVPISGHVSSKRHREFAVASGEMSPEQFAEFNITWISQCVARMKAGALLATFIDWRSVDTVIQVGKGANLHLLNVVVWAKPNAGMGSLWRSQHELLPVFEKSGAPHVNNVALGKHGRWRSNVWTYPGASSPGSDARKMLEDHPTPKPVAMLEDALVDVTNRKDVVLEPFAGSGSTLIACEKTDRVCRAIELDERYVDLIVKRWEELTGESALLEASGATFGEVRQLRAEVQLEGASDVAR